MTFSFEEQLAQAMESLAEQQAKMAEATEQLRAMTASATSKDRTVTAKVGSQGEVLALTFHSTAYRSMAPAQLSALLVDVLNEAKARMGEQVIASMRAFEGVGETLRMNFTGEREDEDLFAAGGLDLESLLAPLTAMRPGADPAAKQAHKQEEFNG
ncbi:YbaB/EbfC family nucleoid-associated protein [Kitasatospora sp. NBC_01300]|uniref:YbaB/EbfC family nucleoid-associated protein n=1 Tax=Kitasatospora sp. NBC_01300 TaxID=2903574 RepID=UPI00352EE927|nr:YbaB/EbfC family nucleoid-associated protein [Kitasatospora sp. NBC_01300]